MVFVFEGQTADEAWRKGTVALLENGQMQQSRNGSTRELLHAVFSIKDPRQRWVVSRVPAMNPAFAIAEVVWIMCGRSDSAFLNFWNSQLPKYAGTGDQYHGAYGFRLRQHLEIDQLDKAYQVLKNDPTSRQIVLQIWDGRLDLPAENGSPVNQDIPCNVLATLKVRDGALEWMQINRSNDVNLGLPHNLVQFTCLQEIIAGWLGVSVGSYVHVSDSFHMYENNPVSIDTSAGALQNADSLMLDKLESERVFKAFSEKIDALVQPVTQQQLTEIFKFDEFNIPYRNLLLVMCAERARRGKWHKLSHTIMNECTNPALQQMWERWQNRISRKSKQNAI